MDRVKWHYGCSRVPLPGIHYYLKLGVKWHLGEVINTAQPLKRIFPGIHFQQKSVK